MKNEPVAPERRSETPEQERGAPNDAEIRRLARLLRGILGMAKESGMIGVLKNGGRSCAQQYNRALARLEQLEAVEPGFFDRIAEEAGFDEIGVAAGLLAEYVSADDEDLPGPDILFKARHGARRTFRWRIRNEIGDAVKEHLPHWIREGVVTMNDDEPGPDREGER